ncbi:outer membrane beta-barrel protein [Marinomonas sp. PE14-40]|uniref:outer membrane beta-barrel protein n=1 Tax=Marinomonas sp. PE14-40 TaxID=3060621 RepID=UPI003F6698F9
MKSLIVLLFSFSQLLYAEEEGVESDFTEGLYVGGAIVTWNYEESGETYNPISFEAIADYRLFNPLDISIRLGMGFGEDESESNPNSVEMGFYKLLYLKPYISLKELKLYGLMGYANYDVESSPNVGTSGISYGVGADYNLFDVANAFLEWRFLPEADSSDLASISMGVILPY